MVFIASDAKTTVPFAPQLFHLITPITGIVIKQFDAVSIDGDDGEEVTFPLAGNNFRRVSSRFAVGEDENTVIPEEDADDIPEDEEIPF